MNSEIHRLFEAASSMPEELREPYLQREAIDPEIRREVLSLLEHDHLAERFFADALKSAATSVLSNLDLAPGTRIGAFAIVHLLGRGGMGAVYLAHRVDRFEQAVAIKVIQAPDPTSLLLTRFEQERQILARLNHPNIANLLDGGETDAGFPYFVMEYVAGEQIDRYCDRHALDLKSRLRLFLRVSAAVQYAHEHLVVHRDLKPANIMVGEEGEPKLLDFGIAKVVDPLAGPGTQLSTGILTPEYSSPEQVRGETITTAADIYSMGAVLYRLLAGSPPHTVENLAPLAAARKISEQAVSIPASVPGDVAAILAKALHRDASRRYRSADEFSKDVQRYLDGKPVLAVSDSVGYKASKFVRRHWIPVLAASAVVLALGIGAGVAIWQGRRAERRFAEVRQLSNHFLFDFEGAIHNVAGATKARELVIKTAQEYLDRLAADAGHDQDLIHELAEAYNKLGDIEGGTVEGNTGDTKAALVSYRRAVALRESVHDESASTTKVRAGYLKALCDLANEETTAGDPARAIPLDQKAVAIADAWLRDGSSDPGLLTAAANAYSQLSSQQRVNGSFQAAIEAARHALALQQRARELRPQDEKLLRSVATGWWSVGSSEKVAGHTEEAIAAFTTTVDLMRQIAASHPENVQSRRELLGASWLLASSEGDLLHKQKQGQEPAVLLWEDAWRIGTQLLSEDPANALVESDVTLISIGLSSALEETGHPRDALRVIAPAKERQEWRVLSAPENRTAAHYLALLEVESGTCQKALHDLTGALKSHRAAMRIFESLVAASPQNVGYRHDKAMNLEDMGEVLASLGDYAGARALYRQGLEIAERLPQGAALQNPAPLIAQLHAADRSAAAH